MFGKIALIQFVLMLAMAGAGVEYFRYSEEVIATLHENNAKLTTAVNTQEETIKAQQKAAQEQGQQMVALQQAAADAELHRRDIEDKLRQKDIAAMARSNAADLEMRMNRATIKSLQDMIDLTTPKDRPVKPTRLEAPAAQNSSTSASATPQTTTIAPTTAPEVSTPNGTSSPQPAPRPPKVYNKNPGSKP